MRKEELSPAAPATLVLGTGNRKKVAELAELLSPLGLNCRGLADFGEVLAVDETGATFAENAALKAVCQARHLQRWVLGDDSGLAVDALQGAPGIYSARFAGAGATDADNRARLLAEMEDVPDARGARFVCHLALSDPEGRVRALASGRCHGRIRRTESGSGGFGYDPLFEIVEYHRTFGELSADVKAVLSHRARATGAMLPLVEALIRSGQWGARG
jgi:XTP/dITP diphosphohydrolase